jgi:CheY-like chemotaxis protein
MKMVVQDTGIGISREFQKVLFTPFSQEGRVDNATNRGSGLGLAITKRFVDLMGGTIAVNSALGKGTTFTVVIVFDSLPEKTGIPEKPVPKKAVDFPLLKGAHILLFEDHPLNQEITKALLEKKGSIVEVAENGQIGLAKFEKSSPHFFHLILMDIRMPILDGFEATRAIRALKRKDAETIPILAMSADAFEEDVKLSLAAGMNGHIAKPVDPQFLYEKIEATLESDEPQ